MIIIVQRYTSWVKATFLTLFSSSRSIIDGTRLTLSPECSQFSKSFFKYVFNSGFTFVW